MGPLAYGLGMMLMFCSVLIILTGGASLMTLVAFFGGAVLAANGREG